MGGPADRAPDERADETEDERQREIGALSLRGPPDERDKRQPADDEPDPDPADQAHQQRGIDPRDHPPCRTPHVGPGDGAIGASRWGATLRVGRIAGASTVNAMIFLLDRHLAKEISRGAGRNGVGTIAIKPPLAHP